MCCMQCRNTENDGKRLQNDSGNVLVLALVFLVVVGTVVGSLVFGIGNDLSNVQNLKSSRTLNYAVSGAANVAAWSGRFVYTPQTSNASICTGVPTSSGVSSLQVNNEWIAVWCKATLNQANPVIHQINREYEIWACLTAPTVATPSTQAACTASPALYAQIFFNDVPSSGTLGGCSSTSTSTCGLSLTVAKWIVKRG